MFGIQLAMVRIPGIFDGVEYGMAEAAHKIVKKFWLNSMGHSDGALMNYVT